MDNRMDLVVKLQLKVNNGLVILKMAYPGVKLFILPILTPILSASW